MVMLYTVSDAILEELNVSIQYALTVICVLRFEKNTRRLIEVRISDHNIQRRLSLCMLIQFSCCLYQEHSGNVILVGGFMDLICLFIGKTS
mmetsp:Transcript_15243/g.37617  ORF Transcript_15243/g.37617 Transcript_15243/m.37617 type:complete len:91 (-) Transcript_15243:22-294(-)